MRYTIAMSLFAESALRAAQSLPKPKLLLILIASVVMNVFALAALIGGLLYFVHSTTWFGAWDRLTDVGFSLLAVSFGYFIFPIFLPLIISFFDTSIADTIEEDEYPGLPPKEPPFWPTIGHDVIFTIKALLLNILCLPLYFIPVVNLLVYYGLNGYLLGTEFFNIVAGRHMSFEEARKLRRTYRLQTILCGMLIAFFATIPFLNLVTPIWGVALMVHYVQGLRSGKDAADDLSDI